MTLSQALWPAPLPQLLRAPSKPPPENPGLRGSFSDTCPKTPQTNELLKGQGCG